MIRATYRVQFRDGFGFEDAARMVPHLAAAGISHLYASPVFTATTGSTHGYDVTDHNELDPSLGGEAGFDVLAAALKTAGVGLILDIVPNHMAASMENPWWRDVAIHGESSAYAPYFDIDWNAGKLILPILGAPFGEVLAAGDIVRRERDGEVVLEVPGWTLPLAPGTEHIEDVELLHEAQNYRLAFWRLGRDGLTYRRFFEVTGLVGVRVEEPAVFHDVHRTILRLVDEGKVTALRVDHVDGLADPAEYLALLREKTDVPILVEKILEGHERLRSWPIEGTTGYEFMAAMASLFVDGTGLATLDEAYAAIADNDLGAMVDDAKTLIVTHNLAGELERLTALALALFATDLSARDHGPVTVREGLIALMKGLDVYRTYLPGDDPADRQTLAKARQEASRARLEDERVLDDLVRLLTTDPTEGGRDEDTFRAFVTRFQQTSGPLMAKAIEDTLFYRYHRLLGLNEVGGELAPTLGPARLLTVSAAGGLAATQTHDTKRGEDARARLYALSDASAAPVFEGVWRTMPGDIPDRLKWAFTQMLFAADPLDEDPALADRFREATLKTVREAKETTSWTRTDADFERRVAEAAEAMVAERRWLAPLADVARAGAVIGLAQAALKTLAGPAPDIYQGTFDWDFAMVDPDNRRPVDFTAEARLCRAALDGDAVGLAREWKDGAIKARVMLEGLKLRRERPGLFRDGRLEPVPLAGAAAGAFAAFQRIDEKGPMVLVVPVRPLSFLQREGLGLDETSLDGLRIGAGEPLTCRLTGARLAAPQDWTDALQRIPVVIATR